MKKISLNENWQYSHKGLNDWKQITLPHDAMLSEPRNGDVPSGKNIGYFEGHDYVYKRTLMIDKSQGSNFILEFEGVYKNAKVFLNGKEIAFRPYGYTNFYVDITDKAIDGENELEVQAFNADQPNSRWYSGSGMYRPAWLYILPENHILLNGIKIKTTDYEDGEINLSLETSSAGTARITIYDGDQEVYNAEEKTNGTLNCSIVIPDVKLWSPETPHLYRCVVNFEGDEQEVLFGVREIECDAKDGFRINGKRIILRGACIHHDNGLLGACAYAYAEERKIKILQKAGYNAIRSAHNPCSKALLDACDRLGMLVMDEYADMWYVHKCRYDYATYLSDWWKQDLLDFVDKDFNHPSVIMYSTGNEVGETSEKRGVELTKKFTEYLHRLDSSRFVTCGINIWFNAMYKMGFGQYSDKKAEKQATEKHSNKNAVGSEFFNNLAGMVGADFMKTMATLPLCDAVTREAFANLDVAGYNYGIKRYAYDLKKYPDRVIVGSETFVNDTYKFIEIAKKNPALIGDFVWVGIDYLGEVGLGAMEYETYAKEFAGGPGWIAAGSGRVDITGKELGEALYTKVAYERLPIAIAVVPVNDAGKKHSPSAWGMTNARDSWSWNGCDGNMTKVEVYARAHSIKLFINDTLVGEKKTKNDCRVIFKTKYYGGKVEAVGYDKDGNELYRTSLETAGEETELRLLPETVTTSKNDLLYVRMQYTDSKGTVKPLARGEITLSVIGGELLGFGNACPYNEKGYLSNTTDTYYGEALAIIKPQGENVTIFAESPFGNQEVIVPVED